MISADKAREKTYNARASKQGTLLNLTKEKIEEACKKGLFYALVSVHLYDEQEILEVTRMLEKLGYGCERSGFLLEVWWRNDE